MTGDRVFFVPAIADLAHPTRAELDQGLDITDFWVEGSVDVVGRRWEPRTEPQFSADEAREQYDQGVVFPRPVKPVTLDSMFPIHAASRIIPVERPEYHDGHRAIDGEVAETVTAERRSCPDCVRCTRSPGPRCDVPWHTNCISCDHCQGSHITPPDQRFVL